ncbi:MAG: iron-containing redox enzyme family protein [Panacagrimonas sp.]
MDRLTAVIERAQHEFAVLLSAALQGGPLGLEVYVRFLSMQYHLTRGVQRYFIVAAAHADLARRKGLRRFLFEFANEEELHYLVAANDLRKLGRDPLPEPFDVTLWHAYFRPLVAERPFIRLGAACILENISAGAARPLVRQALSTPFLTRDNTKFLVLHQHETLPHGEQMVQALVDGNLGPQQIEDVLDGARKGLVMYLRMAEWALNPETLSGVADGPAVVLGSSEREEIETFQMEHLDAPVGAEG